MNGGKHAGEIFSEVLTLVVINNAKFFPFVSASTALF
jgi:hypothetical protein